MHAQEQPFDNAGPKTRFFLGRGRDITLTPHPSNQRTQGPGLPHQRHPDDPIYLGIFWVVLILGACYLGWRYL